MAKQVSRPSHGGVPRILKFSVLATLAVAVLGLSAFALSEQPKVEGAGIVPTLPTPQPEPTPEPAQEPEVPAYVAPAVQRLLAVGVDDGHVLRATTGACPEPAGGVEVSFDHGVNWEAGVIASVDARRILQLDASDSEIVRMTSLNGDCTPGVSRSFVGGTSWEPDPGVTGWFIDPSNPLVVHTPSGVVELPCNAVGLSAEAARGVVLCSDSTVLASEDDGANWSAPAVVPNAAAVGVTAEGYAIASVGESECAGVRTRLLSAGALGEPGACLEVADAGSGQMAVAGHPAGWYLWAGSVFLRSTDQGISWG